MAPPSFGIVAWRLTGSDVDRRVHLPEVDKLYTPKHFRETDPDELQKLIDAHAFGVLISIDRGRPFASHIPFVYEREAGLLHGHVARANPQWRHFEHDPAALVIFQGPHGYISPAWYVDAGVPSLYPGKTCGPRTRMDPISPTSHFSTMPFSISFCLAIIRSEKGTLKPADPRILFPMKGLLEIIAPVSVIPYCS